MRYVVTREPDPRPSLLVETCAEADEEALRRFKDRLHGVGCSHGVLFDPADCVIVRDSFTSLDVDSLVVESRLSTEAVLGRVGSAGAMGLDGRVEIWLQVLADNWKEALPDRKVADHFLSDIVPAASGSMVSRSGLP